MMEGAPPPPPPPPPPPGAGSSSKDDASESSVRRTYGVAPLTNSALFNMDSACSLQAINWAKATRVTCSDAGSAGVFFFTFQDGTKVVVKGSGEPARELFITGVAREANIPVPAMLPLAIGTQERRCVGSTISRLAQGDCSYRASKSLNRPVILLMEYVSGHDLMVMGRATLWKSVDGARKLKLRGLGKLIALDMLANNWDRVPVVWNNKGNFANVMIQESGMPVGIDNAFSPILREISGRRNSVYDGYLDKVGAVLDAICEDPLKECAQMRSARHALKRAAGYDWMEQGSLVIQWGILQGALALCYIPPALHAEHKQALRNMVKQDWQNVWRSDVDRISLDFLNDVTAVFTGREAAMEAACERYTAHFGTSEDDSDDEECSDGAPAAAVSAEQH